MGLILGMNLLWYHVLSLTLIRMNLVRIPAIKGSKCSPHPV